MYYTTNIIDMHTFIGIQLCTMIMVRACVCVCVCVCVNHFGCLCVSFVYACVGSVCVCVIGVSHYNLFGDPA